MGYFRAAPVVSAVFDREDDVKAAVADLHALGFHDDHIRHVEMDAGMYQLEDEFTPERSWRIRELMGLAALVGVVLGLVVVLVALGRDAGIGSLLVGAAGGTLFGLVCGGVAGMVYVLPMDDDEDVFFAVRDGQAEYLLEVEINGPISVRAVRGVLIDRGARAFLAPAFPATAQA